MKTVKSEYDEYGWRIIVKKGKDITQIYLRSKNRIHNIHKPFYLRLSDKDLKLLKKLLKEVEK